MKELHGGASGAIAAPLERCFSLLAAVEEYPRWYPEAVRGVRVLERAPDGAASRAAATLAVALGPLTREFELTLAISLEPPVRVTLTRLPNEPADPEEFEVRWRLAPPGPATDGTRIDIELAAKLDVPRLMPVGGVGAAIAEGFLAAAVRELSRSR